MFVTALYKVYIVWTFCFTGYKALMKVYQWFYWIYVSKILNFERSLSLSPGP